MNEDDFSWNLNGIYEITGTDFMGQVREYTVILDSFSSVYEFPVLPGVYSVTPVESQRWAITKGEISKYGTGNIKAPGFTADIDISDCNDNDNPWPTAHIKYTYTYSPDTIDKLTDSSTVKNPLK